MKKKRGEEKKKRGAEKKKRKGKETMVLYGILWVCMETICVWIYMDFWTFAWILVCFISRV